MVRSGLEVLPAVTTPPMCPGHLPTCWASSVWYEPATGELSKSATRRTASPREQCTAQTTNPLFSFFFPYLFRLPRCYARLKPEEVYAGDFSCRAHVWIFSESLCKPSSWRSIQSWSTKIWNLAQVLLKKKKKSTSFFFLDKWQIWSGYFLLSL